MTPRISILICSYNSWNYIISTIQSVLVQTYTHFELLILDNNSKDYTIQNIESFHDDRIKLFESKINYWPYWWLNYLLEKSTWDYIAILDHDDLWAKNKLEKQVEFLDNNLDFVWCGTQTVYYHLMVEVEQMFQVLYYQLIMFYTFIMLQHLQQ